MNANTGEVLAMASHPGYDPNKLDAIGALLPKNKDAPLVNRAAQGAYPIGTAGSPFTLALGLPEQPNATELRDLYGKLGFYTTPDMRMPVARASGSGEVSELRVSPLQMAIAACALSNGGVRPAPRIALAVNTPQQGWVVLPAVGHGTEALPETFAKDAANKLAAPSATYWEYGGLAQSEQQTDTWFLAGTLPGWKATPLAVAVLIEGNYPMSAQRIGEQLILVALRP
jgi:hypothetical protein